MKIRLVVLVICTVAVACRKAPSAPSSSEPSSMGPVRHRPPWIAEVSLHIENIRACLAEKMQPAGVVYVTSLRTGGTGLTTVDGLGATEHCAAKDGEVLYREPDPMRASELETLAVFTPAHERPAVGELVLLEEVLDEDRRTIGFLHWPGESAASSRRARNAAVHPASPELSVEVGHDGE